MKVAIIYNPKDNKLVPESYSQTYREMFLALAKELNAQLITNSCSAKDIDADAIIFFDPHSTHWVYIDGIEEHKAVKYEFMDDPHQIEMFGVHKVSGIRFQKLGAGGRIQRAWKRGIDFIICPHKLMYERYFSPYGGRYVMKKLVWFPCAPEVDNFQDRHTPLAERKREILANGATWSFPWLPSYTFRKWAFEQPEVTFIPHYIKDRSSPMGKDYPQFLSKYAGAIAACNWRICPKHLQVPLSGSVCFVQPLDEYKELGFKDMVNCVFIDKNNFHDRVSDFLNNTEFYQGIADAGRELVENNYTAKHFALFVRKHIENRLREIEAERKT